MIMSSNINRTVTLDEEQNYALEEWKWTYRKSCSKIMRILISHYMKNPEELKKIVKEVK